MRRCFNRMYVWLAVPATFLVAGPTLAQDPAGGDSAYRVILFLAENGGPADVQLTRLEEVWNEGDGTERLRALLNASTIRRLDAVTVLPGQETPAIRVGEVTVRVNGVLKEPRKDAMFLRVEVDGGREALVKEMISGFNETLVLAYPLAEGDRSIVALIVPVARRN